MGLAPGVDFAATAQQRITDQENKMRTAMCMATLGLCVLATGLADSAVQAQGDKDNEKIVRPLQFAPKDPTVVFMIGGQSTLIRLTDAEAVEKLVGKSAAHSLIDLVDFKKEAIVLVSWTTSGPPEGVLKHETKGDGAGRRVQFYVQGPPGGGARGQRARIGADFFAVSREVKATFDPVER